MPGGNLLVRGGAAQGRFQPPHRFLDLARLLADGAGHPVDGAQLVEDGAADPGDRVGLELHVLAGIELVDGVEEAEHPETDKIVELDVLRHAHGDLPRHVLHQRGVLPHEEVPQLLILRASE